MMGETFEQWMKLNKNFSIPFSEWNKISTDIYQTLVAQNLEILGENCSRMSDQMRRMSHVKRPEDLIHLQRECINENMTAGIENIQKLVNTSIENMEHFTKLFSTFTEPVSNMMHKGAEKTKKYTEKA